MQIKRYSKYKISRLSTLDNVPDHWIEKRAKYFFSEIDERSVTGSEEMLSVSHLRGVVRRKLLNVSMFQSESNEGQKLCQLGDVVINTMWAWMAALGVSKETGIVSPSYGVYRPRQRNSYHPDFLDYLLRIEAYRIEYVHRSTGIRSSRLRLYPDRFLDMPILCPPYDEQKAIIKFLNFKSSQIQRLIQQKKRLIGLLKEQKQVIINQAVTRGLDPNVRLKPSGVQWIGDIPEHWKISRLRNLATVRASGVDKHTVEGEPLVRICNYVDVYKNDEITDQLDYMQASATPGEVVNFKLLEDDVIITKDSEDWRDIGVPSYVPRNIDNLICGYHLSLIRPYNELINGRFLYTALLSNTVADQFRISATGVTRFGLSKGEIKSVLLHLPPIEEQEAISEYVKSKNDSIKQLISRIQKEIHLIQEYRTRLISDVVTGQIDVRNTEIGDIVEEELIEEPLEEEQEEEEESLELVGVDDDD